MSVNLEQYLIHPIERPVDDSEAKVDLIRSKDNPIMSFFYESCFIRHDYVFCATEYALPYDEFFCFCNTADDNDYLGATLSMEIAGEKFVTNRCCMIQIPAFVPHGHITISELTSPIFCFVTGAGLEHTSLPKELWHPEYVLPRDDMIIYHNENDGLKDDHACPEQFWVMRGVPGRTIKGERTASLRRFFKTDGWVYIENAHLHASPEILAYYGADPWHPYELGGRYAHTLNGQTLYFDKPTVVFLPSYLPHCPIIVERVDKENFWHSTGLTTGPAYGKPIYDIKSFNIENGKAKVINMEEPW